MTALEHLEPCPLTIIARCALPWGHEGPCEQTKSSDAAFAQFAQYVAREMPEGTVIGDPAWWAPRLWRFAQYANSFEAGRVNAPQGTTSELVAQRPQGSASESPALLTSNGVTLLPCPFCGRSDTTRYGRSSEFHEDCDGGDGGNDDYFAVFCDASEPRGLGGCGASAGFAKTCEEAAERWNRRSAVETTGDLRVQNLLLALDAKQAKIDALMMEFCPGEMSREQREEWAKHQQPVSADLERSITESFARSPRRVESSEKSDGNREPLPIRKDAQ